MGGALMFRKRRAVPPHFRTPVPFNPFTGKFAQFGPEDDAAAGTGTGFRFYRSLLYLGAGAEVAEGVVWDIPVGFSDTTYTWLPLTATGWSVSDTDETIICTVAGIYEFHLGIDFYIRDCAVGDGILQLERDGSPTYILRSRGIYPVAYDVSNLYHLLSTRWYKCEVGDKIYPSFYNLDNQAVSVHGDPKVSSYFITAQWLDNPE